GRRAHARPFRREYPERLELPRIHLFLDFIDLEVDLDLVGITVSVEVAPQHDGAIGSAGDRGLAPAARGRVPPRSLGRAGQGGRVGRAPAGRIPTLAG